MSTPTYEHTRAWKQALSLVAWVYKLTARFPADEKSGLAGGMRKSAAALPLKIADCWGMEEYEDAAQAVDAGHNLLRDTLVQAQVAEHLSMMSHHHLVVLCKRINHAADALDLLLEELFEEEDEALAA